MAEVDIFHSAEFACLSNFAPGSGFWTVSHEAPFRQWWPSAEHFFQAGKFLEPQLQQQVRLAGEPGVAKHLGRTLGPLRPDWDQVKRDRLQQAMREKLWAHRGPREALLSIPEGVRIVSANPADPYFGTGPDGCGQNVIGKELQKLRTFFGSYLQRRRLTLKVANVGGPWEPFSKEIDVTGTVPSEVAELAAKALGLTPEVLSVDLVTEGGFEKIPVESFGSAADLESFLAKNAGDCLAEVNLTEVAAVTLWNGTDDSYIGRADLLHLCRSCDDLLERFKMMVPLLRHTGFAPTVNFSIDDSEPRTLDEACMSEIRAAAEEMADVVISARYTLPDQPQAALLSAPEVDEPAQVVLGRHTALSPEALRDRVKGLVWGAALGDAVGLCTEFMTKAGAAEKYADPAKLSPASRVADKHRSRWGQGDWTDDTDQLVLVLDAVVAGNGVLDQRLFAKSLKPWRQNGFPELGDTAGLGIGQTVSAVLEHPAYDVAPDVAADAEWRQYGCSMAANGAVMRCAAAAVGRFWDAEVVRYNAAAAAAVTHADPRCITSSVAVALLAARVLTGVDLASRERREEEVASITLQVIPHLEGGDADELWQHTAVAADGLEKLCLGSGGIGYTYKPLGAAAWAFVHADSFKEAIQRITMEAGDADSNATVAGALLGARLGFSNLPPDWLQELAGPQCCWLEQRVAACLQLLGI